MVSVKRKPAAKASEPESNTKHVLYARLDAELMRALRERNISEQSSEGPHVSLAQTVTRLLRQSLMPSD